MNFEQEMKGEMNLSFEKDETKEGVSKYLFKKVAVGIDSTGKNYTELPEISFGTFDTDYKRDILSQPKVKREGVDMEYVSKCVEVAAKDYGQNTFWFYPFGDDRPEQKATRENARVRLFQQYFDIEPEPTGFGYIMTLKN